MFDSMFNKSFNSGKCKTLLRLAISRIKLLRNKRDIQLKQMKRELVQLLQSNQEPSARIRVEHIYREQNVMAAYEIIELFCELVVVRLPIIDSQRQCPIDLKEAVASLIFAAPRCSDLPELLQVRNLFAAKYGKEFVAAAAELRPDSGVNRLIIEKLSIRPPSGEVKLKLMKEIAGELNIEWDPTASEVDLLKAPEDLLEGPKHFLGATQMSLNIPNEEPSSKEPTSQYNQGSDRGSGPRESRSFASQTSEAPVDEKQFIPFVLPSVPDNIPYNRSHSTQATAPKNTKFEYKDEEKDDSPVLSREQSFKDVAAAARAAAISAERAAAAARAAALLATKSFKWDEESDNDDGNGSDGRMESPKYQHDKFDSNHPSTKTTIFDEPVEHSSQSTYRAPSGKPTFDDSDDVYEDNRIGNQELYSKKFTTRNWQFDDDEVHSQSASGRNSRPPKFDTDEGPTSDSSEPGQSISNSSQVYPQQLPDYDDLIARFQSLRSASSDRNSRRD